MEAKSEVSSDSKKLLRIAVVQLTSHPCITIEDNDYSAEPFLMPHPQMLLADLACRPGGQEIYPLQEKCRESYFDWSGKRLDAVIEHLAGIKVDLVVFPEFSIPFEHLPKVAKFSSENRVTVVCGNHSFNRDIDSYQNLMQDLKDLNPEFDKDTISSKDFGIHTNLSSAARSMLVVFYPNSSFEGEEKLMIRCRFKARLSPFEYTSSYSTDHDSFDLNSDHDKWEIDIVHPHPYKLQILVCAEALQNAKISNDVNIVAICAYHQKPEDFNRLIDPSIKNQQLAILASEGAFGGSQIAFNEDRRAASWWLRTPLNGVLPPGDAIVVYQAPITPMASPLGSTSVLKDDELICVCPVISCDPKDNDYRAAKEIERLLREEDIWDEGLFDDSDRYDSSWSRLSKEAQADLAKKISFIADRKKPKGVLSSLIRHVSRLASAGQIERKVLASLTNICFYHSDLERSRSSESLSLNSLEELLASEIHRWLRNRLESGGRSADSSAAYVNAQSICLEKFRKNNKLGPIPAAYRFLKKNKEDVANKAYPNLNKILGSLIERFSASSGWIFNYKYCCSIAENSENSGKICECANRGLLTEVLSHNVTLGERKENIKVPSVEEVGCSISSLAIIRGKGVILDHVIDSPLKIYYRKKISSTKAVLAVPVFDTDGKKIKGVVTLESQIEDVFFDFQIGALQAAVWEFLPDLLIVEALSKDLEIGYWHPEIHGWGYSKLLNNFCNSIATSVLEKQNLQALSCTIWQADWDKSQLFALGAARFNYEYITEKTLPLNVSDKTALVKGLEDERKRIKSVPLNSWISSLGSYTATVAISDPKSVITVRVVDEPSYHRPDKAERMGVNTIKSSPIYSLSNFPNGQGLKSDEHSRSIGVLSLYFFNEQLPEHTFSIDGSFSEQDVTNLSDITGSVISEVAALREEVSVATLLWRLSEYGVPFVNLGKIFCETLKMCLEADTVAILIAKNTNNESGENKVTSGMNVFYSTVELNLEPVDEEHPFMSGMKGFPYENCCSSEDFDNRWKLVTGFTGFLAAFPDSILRKNDIPDKLETGCWAPTFSLKNKKKAPLSILKKAKILGISTDDASNVIFAPSNKSSEEGEPTVHEHRRFLGVSIQLDEHAQTVGIIRVLRDPTRKPFTWDDGLLLHKFSNAFRAHLNFIAGLKEHDWSKSREIKVLSNPDGFVNFWNVRYVESILQRLLFSCDSKDGAFEFKWGYLRSFKRNSVGYYKGFEVAEFFTDTTHTSPRKSSAPSLEEDSVLRDSCIYFFIESKNEVNKANSVFRLSKREGRLRFALKIPMLVKSTQFESESGADSVLSLEGYILEARIIGSISARFRKLFNNSWKKSITQSTRLLQCIGRKNVFRDAERFFVKCNEGNTYAAFINSVARKYQWKAFFHSQVLELKSAWKVRFWYGWHVLPLVGLKWQGQDAMPEELDQGERMREIRNSWRSVILASEFASSISDYEVIFRALDPDGEYFSVVETISISTKKK